MRPIKIQFDGDVCDFVSEYTRKHGLKFFDSGAFGSVYVYRGSQNRKRVVKVVDLAIDYADDDGYLTYFKQIILKQQDNPFVPRIYNVEVYKVTDKLGSEHLVYFIEMERLRRAKAPTLKRLLKKVFPYNDGGRGQFDPVLDYHDLIKAVVASRNKHFRRLSRHLLRLIDRFENDLHLGNVMLRRKGRGHQLVITDPIS